MHESLFFFGLAVEHVQSMTGEEKRIGTSWARLDTKDVLGIRSELYKVRV